MKKIKVIHVLNTGSFSGAENVAITIIEELKKKSEIECYYVSLNGEIEKILEESNINYVPLKELNVRSLKRVVKEIKPDIIHAHDFRASIIAMLCFSKAKIISHLHNNSPWIKDKGLYSYLYLLSSVFYSKIITVSDSIESEYVFANCIKKKFICIGNPLNTDKVRIKANETHLGYFYDVAYLGRLSEQKNPFLMIDIFNELISKLPTIKIAIIGNGELYDFVCDKLKFAIDNGNVVMYGFLENPYGILKNSKVMCLPSKWEGFGLAAFESLSVGTPVVCSGVGGLKGIVDSSCGKICCFDKEVYVNEILEIINNEEYYKEKSLYAIEKANKLSNVSEYIKKIEKMYMNDMEIS